MIAYIIRKWFSCSWHWGNPTWHHLKIPWRIPLFCCGIFWPRWKSGSGPGRRRGNVECNARASDEEVLSLTDEETFATLDLEWQSGWMGVELFHQWEGENGNHLGYIYIYGCIIVIYIGSGAGWTVSTHGISRMEIMGYNWDILIYAGFLSHRATPSSHPF